MSSPRGLYAAQKRARGNAVANRHRKTTATTTGNALEHLVACKGDHLQPTVQWHFDTKCTIGTNAYARKHTHTKFRIKVMLTFTKVISPRTVLAHEMTLMTCTGEVSSSNLSSVSSYSHM